ncbi:hypothetical protein [Nocardioides nanhaiensis]|uniref:Uncharacterized protein n=1 Tax=Nocardioides nanhaiensis TaxID=1476871 RepID=A0ABP8WCM0_9ACTN
MLRPLRLIPALLLLPVVGCAAEESDDVTAQVCRQAAVADASLEGVRRAVIDDADLPPTAASSYAAAIDRLGTAVADPGTLDEQVEERLLTVVAAYSRSLAAITRPVDVVADPSPDDISTLVNAEQRVASELQDACAS